jgi:hypothetical protein
MINIRVKNVIKDINNFMIRNLIQFHVHLMFKKTNQQVLLLEFS